MPVAVKKECGIKNDVYLVLSCGGRVSIDPNEQKLQSLYSFQCIARLICEGHYSNVTSDQILHRPFRHRKRQGGQVFGYGIIGTIVIVCLIVWLLRRV